MSNPRIEVDVVANVAGVASGVNAATSELDKLGKAAQSTAPKFEQLSKATSRYNGIGIDFARVIQDAPFGIIGVGNNIQQLAQSFSSLGNAGDSTSSKLKLAFSSIFSTGNLLVLAVSAITTALTFYEKGAFKSEDATKSLSEGLEKYRKTLDNVTRTSIEGQANAAKEIQSFSLLRAQAENTTISQEKRNQAVAQLQKQYPEYLKGLTEEQIKTGQVGEAYNELTKGLIATAKARAASDQIAKNSLDTLTILAQEEQRALEILKARDKLESIVANKTKTTGQDKTALTNQEAIQQKRINDLIKEQLESANQRNKIEQENSKLIGTINTQVSQGATFNKANGKEIDANKEKLKQYSAGWDEFNLQQEIARELQDKLTASTQNYEKRIISALSSYDKIKSKEVKVNLEFKGLPQQDEAEKSPFDVYLDSLQFAIDKLPTLEQQVSDFAFTINDLLKNNVTDAFVDLGFSIGEALASGGNVLKAIGGSLLRSFSRFLGQFGEQLIAYGVAASAFGKVSLALATPGAAIIAAPLAIAAGIALTAIAGAIGSIGQKGPGGGGGGSGAGGGSAAQGSSFVGGAQGGMFASNRDLNGELVVRGQDLVYVFGQASDRINKG